MKINSIFQSINGEVCSAHQGSLCAPSFDFKVVIYNRVVSIATPYMLNLLTGGEK